MPDEQTNVPVMLSLLEKTLDSFGHARSTETAARRRRQSTTP